MAVLDDLPPAVDFRSGGQRLVLRRLGVGPRLLLVHGGPGLDHHVMLPLALALARDFEVWLPDLPGHGRSQPAGASLPDLAQVVDRFGAWLDELKPAVELAAGHSLGAWVLRELALRRRFAPRAAAWISPPVAIEAAGGPVRRPPVLARSRRRDAALRTDILEFCVADSPDPASPELVAALARAVLRPPESYVGIHGALRRALHARPVSHRPGYPVLLLCGEADRIAPPAAVARLAAATVGSTLRVLPRLGHVPFASDADPVAAVLGEFFGGR